MQSSERVAQAGEIMRRFSELTGVVESGARQELDLALRLVNRVHHLLGRHRDDDPRRGRIEEFWLNAGNQRSATWTGHRDINMVTLATSLAPDGFLLPATSAGNPG
jgi:hypothetical protein